jgi:hypothetical protein
MKNINSNYIRKQFSPAPIFLIAASIIMATSSVTLLHSQGQAFGLGGVLYLANEVLRDDVLIATRLSSYNHLYIRDYEGGTYESNASISSTVNATNSEVKHEYAREVFAGLHGKVQYYERDANSPFTPMIGAGKSPEELEAESAKGKKFPREYFLAVRAFSCAMENADWETTHEDDFAYNITWKYQGKENGDWWWRNARHFQMTLSNWKNQQMSCDKFYPENSAIFTTKDPIKNGNKKGGIIEALPYQSLFGRVNLGANTPNANIDFEPINKRP